MTDPNRTLDAYLDGQLTPEQLAEIESALCRDPGFAEDFASAMLIDSCLREKFQWQELVKALHLDDEPAQGKDPGSLSAHDFAAAGSYVLRLALTSKPAKKLYAYAGVAAVLLLALILFNPFADSNDSNETPFAGHTADETNNPIEPGPVGPALSNTVATLTASHDAKWAPQPGGDHRPGALRQGTQLSAGQLLVLTAGFAEITTNDGAVAILEAPASIELTDNDNALYLHAGKLVGLCYTDSSKGFVVKTHHADITDLGTEFGVEVSDNQFTATVLTGEVAIRTPGNQSQVLTDDQTATLSPKTSATLTIEQGLDKGFSELLPRIAQAHALRNDPAMIAYWGFEAEDLVDGKLLNRAAATLGKMDGTLGQAGKPDSAPTLTEGRRPGTNALRFEAKEFDIVRIGAEDARALNGLEQLTIGLWVKPDHMDQASHHVVTKRRGNTCTLNLALVWNDGAFDPNVLLFHSDRGGLDFNEHTTAGETLPRQSDWLHVVVTFDRGERRYYVNGELVGTKPSVATGKTFAMDAELCIGSVGAFDREAATHLDGDLDELFILGRVMPHDEIATLYETGVAQP